jgi:hypothetical protein
MNVRNGDTVSAVAVVVEEEAQFAAGVVENGDSPEGDGAIPTAETGSESETEAEPEAEHEPDNGSGNGSPE